MRAWAMLLLFCLVSCSSGTLSSSSLHDGTTAQTYVYRDESGEFECAREVRKDHAKMATRTRLLSPSNSGERTLEKTFALSEMGSVKNGKGRATAVRPMLAQHTVWLEGKKYFSQLKLLPKEHKLNVIMQSPEEKWNGQKNLNVPSGRIFCFYSQLPECLLLSGLLEKVRDGADPRATFYVVWDSYPYHQEHFSGLDDSPFTAARLVLEKVTSTGAHFNVEMAGQMVGLHFSKKGEFRRMFWTAQGISVMPPGEANNTQ